MNCSHGGRFSDVFAGPNVPRGMLMGGERFDGRPTYSSSPTNVTNYDNQTSVILFFFLFFVSGVHDNWTVDYRVKPGDLCCQ